MSHQTALVNHLQRELNLPRIAGRFADHPEAAARHDVIGQAEVHDIENIEELGAKFERAEFGIAAATEGRVFDQSDIKIVKGGAAESVAAQCSETSLVGASATRQVNG